MKLKFQKIDRPTITETIIDQIKQMILSGEMKKGQKLPPERQLAEMLSVGRTSVREAVRALQYMGILEVRSGDGTFLTENVSLLSDHFKTSFLIKHFSVIELVEARKIIEVETVCLAAERSSEEEKENLKGLFKKSVQVKNDVSAFLKADFAFHRKIAEMSQNSVLVEFFTAMRELTLEENLEVIKKQGQIDKAIEFHLDILDAICSFDPAKARQVMMSHLENIEETVREISAKTINQEGESKEVI
jgi:GntR family transcriptional repressor for pyruvate dehydrogenase complex